MISDNQLYSLAVFLGCMSMLLIVLYHFLEVNAKEDTPAKTPTAQKSSQATTTAAGQGMRAEKGATRPVNS